MVLATSTSELPAVDDRDRAVLKAFADDAEATLAFQGIRRSLNLHPEKLSRALRRLEGAGVIVHTKDGYKLTEAGIKAVPADERGTVERLTIMDTMVPALVSPEAVVEQLKLKWFSNLRWVGFASHNGVVALRWVTEDGRTRVTATLDQGRLVVDAEGALADGVGDAITGAQAIFAHIARAAAQSPMAPESGDAWRADTIHQT